MSVTGSDIFGNAGSTILDTTATTAYTWQAWIRPSANVVGVDDYILATSLASGGNNGFSIAGRIDTSERLDVFKQQAGPSAPADFSGNNDTALPTALFGGWYQIITTWDSAGSGSLKTYINGTAAGTTTEFNGGAVALSLPTFLVRRVRRRNWLGRYCTTT